MKKVYYVVENTAGEEESKAVKTMAEARKELKFCKDYYKSEGMKPVFELFIAKHTEVEEDGVITEYVEEVR